MTSDIYTLYKGILYGLCPCHGYNSFQGRTGGFYHLVCRHGVSSNNIVYLLFHAEKICTELAVVIVKLVIRDCKTDQRVFLFLLVHCGIKNTYALRVCEGCGRPVPLPQVPPHRFY